MLAPAAPPGRIRQLADGRGAKRLSMLNVELMYGMQWRTRR
jgi:hypothetical protein